MMAYHLKQDPETLMKARTILSSELGDEAWTLPDKDIIGFRRDAAEQLHLGRSGAMTPEVRRLAEEIGKTRRGRWLGKALDIYPPLPVSVEEMLHRECAEAR